MENKKKKSLNLKYKLKNVLKKIIKPFIKPVYSRLMFRVENRINDKIASNSARQINEITNFIDDKNSELYNRVELLVKENNEMKDFITNINDICNIQRYNPYTGGKIRIGFIFQAPSFWPSFECVYEKILSDDRFEFVFYHLDLSYKEPSQMKSAKDFLKKNNIKHKKLDINTLKQFNPHVLIIQTPYDEWHRTDEFSSTNLRKLGFRLIYIPYGIEFAGDEESLKLQYNSKFINNMWRIYTISETIQKYYCIYSKLSLENVKSFGHPKFESLYKRKYNTNYNISLLSKGKKVILVKIHFPRKFQGNIVTPNMEVYMNLVDNIEKYSKKVYFIFMLHPLMFDEEKHGEYRELINKIIEKENKQYCLLYKDDDYREPLYYSDAFITDRSSLSVEMGIFKKPILFLENNVNKEIYIEEFNNLFNSYIKGDSYSSIDYFIKGIIEKKIKSDNLNYLNIYSKIVPHISENISKNIVDDIYNSIIYESNNRN